MASALFCALGFSPASAAELRLTLGELASLVAAVTEGAKLHLDNQPGGIFSMASGSYIEIAGKQTPITLPVKTFNVFGSTYAYYVADLNSQSIRVSAVESAVRITLSFGSNEGDFVADCIAGECGLTKALPKVVWRNGSIAIDVAPVRFGTSIALAVRNVTIGGVISARCGSGLSGGLCELALPYANRTIAQLKPKISSEIKAKVNDPQMQETVANVLKKYLTVGQAGEIVISDVSTGASTVTIKFLLPGTGAGG